MYIHFGGNPIYKTDRQQFGDSQWDRGDGGGGRGKRDKWGQKEIFLWVMGTRCRVQMIFVELHT